eukprot:scaffold50855_cov28-Tisochrysis_lutea.AAC.2
MLHHTSATSLASPCRLGLIRTNGKAARLATLPNGGRMRIGRPVRLVGATDMRPPRPGPVRLGAGLTWRRARSFSVLLGDAIIGMQCKRE